MDVRDGIRSIRRLLLATGLSLGLVGPAQADPIYNVIDLGTGGVTYGADPSGTGMVTGSNGQTYTFIPMQNDLPSQWSNTSQGIPISVAAPVGSPDTNGNPAYAYSQSTLSVMNSQGLAVGADIYGVDGHLSNTEVFATQLQANGSWGIPTPLWAGGDNFGGTGGTGVGILGLSSNGQVLGYGYNLGYAPGLGAGGDSGVPQILLYDSKSQSFTNLTSLIDSTTSPNGANWFLNGQQAQIDAQGRILITQDASEGFPGSMHSLLLVPEGLSSGPIATPEPATWAVFATLIGGWMARKRLGSRHRP